MYSKIAETSQKPHMELSRKTANGFNPLAIFTENADLHGFHLRFDIYAYVYKYMRASR